jgi:biopolymer transport protein ExbB/TolQ
MNGKSKGIAIALVATAVGAIASLWASNPENRKMLTKQSKNISDQIKKTVNYKKSNRVA